MEMRHVSVELMERTMANLRIIDELHANRRERGAPQPFEVTQLVNSLLGALAYPWEELRRRESGNAPWDFTPSQLQREYGFPVLHTARRTDVPPTDFRDLVRQLRNGMAHGNITFKSDHRREIATIEVWNKYDGMRTWGTEMSPHEMRQFLEAFSRFAKDPLLEKPR